MSAKMSLPRFQMAGISITKRPTPRWLIWLIVALAVFNGLPFLAPVFMKLGWIAAANAIYLIYSPFCHQMAQRSFFLFGPEGFQMHNASELPVNSAGPLGPLALKNFAGNAELGWKVAWSDRMVSMYGSPLIAAIGYALARKLGAVRPLSWKAMALFALPITLDGVTHFISDFAGVGAGFRDSNAWLAALTGNALPAWFYAGDALGSFNSWARLITGLLAGLGIGWFALPYMDEAGQDWAALKAGSLSEEPPNADRPAAL